MTGERNQTQPTAICSGGAPDTAQSTEQAAPARAQTDSTETKRLPARLSESEPRSGERRRVAAPNRRPDAPSQQQRTCARYDTHRRKPQRGRSKPPKHIATETAPPTDQHTAHSTNNAAAKHTRRTPAAPRTHALPLHGAPTTQPDKVEAGPGQSAAPPSASRAPHRAAGRQTDSSEKVPTRSHPRDDTRPRHRDHAPILHPHTLSIRTLRHGRSRAPPRPHPAPPAAPLHAPPAPRPMARGSDAR